MAGTFTTRQAAQKLGIDVSTLSRYISTGKVPAPPIMKVGELKVHAWSEQEIERMRQLLPKIKNGRKTRWRKEAKTKRQTKSKKN